ncbi:MAG: alpha-L-arabinofuranosidase C-terminal domain-containing protein [Luteolibacter sp.]
MKPLPSIRFPGILLLACCSIGGALAADPVKVTIEAAAPVAKMSPLHYGLMTEEINHCYDGGLYAELVQNRVFKDDVKSPVHWSVVQGGGAAATIALDQSQPLNEALTTSLKLDVTAATPAAPAGVANDGYWGIPVKPETRYRALFYAKAAPGAGGPVTVSITGDDGTVFATAITPALTGEWKSYQLLLTTGKVTATTNAKLVLTVERPGSVWFNLVSLFPPTWKDRPNGLRQDLMQMLVDMKPAFLRFPGGNYLEGDTIETRFDWKKTLGPVAHRAGHPGPWGYRSTDGMGLMEFLQWCEDMNAEPVLAVYAGYSLKGEFVKPGKDLEPYIQDAFDEIEYVTGPVSSKWGAQRAKDGHPAPFKLENVEIGNEDFFDKSGSYDGRFKQFQEAIKGRYPKLKCISTVGNEQPADKRVHSIKPDAIDEHYYRSFEEFVKMTPGYYEKYDRKGPEIFVGEWAAYETGFPPWDKRSKAEPPTPNMKAALADAVFMTGMERNSDIVTMQCYAPLFVNLNPGAYQWRPNLIGYDALRAYGSPSYHAIRMFSNHHGDEILKATVSDPTVHQSVTRDSKTGRVTVKLVNPTAEERPVEIDLKGVRSLGAKATAITMAAAQDATNTLDEPLKVAPVTTELADIKPGFNHILPANSITILLLETR